MQTVVRRLAELGPFPSEASASESDLPERQVLLEQINEPISEDEPEQLFALLGSADDSLFGLKWTVLIATPLCATAMSVALFLGACTPTVPRPSQLSSLSSTLPAVSPAPTMSTAAPSASEVTSTIELPNPGGTCLASQFEVGKADSGYTFSTLYSRHVVIDQPLTNTGVDCVLALPKVIGVASATGMFEALDVPNMGHQVCSNGACRYVYPTSFEIRSRQSVKVVLNTWWWSAYSDTATEPTPPPCGGPTEDVTRAEFPLASGSIEIDWDIVVQEVCSSPVTMNMTIENT
jgi:hypothetical protein